MARSLPHSNAFIPVVGEPQCVFKLPRIHIFGRVFVTFVSLALANYVLHSYGKYSGSAGIHKKHSPSIAALGLLTAFSDGGVNNGRPPRLGQQEGNVLTEAK